MQQATAVPLTLVCSTAETHTTLLSMISSWPFLCTFHELCCLHCCQCLGYKVAMHGSALLKLTLFWLVHEICVVCSPLHTANRLTSASYDIRNSRAIAAPCLQETPCCGKIATHMQLTVLYASATQASLLIALGLLTHATAWGSFHITQIDNRPKKSSF